MAALSLILLVMVLMGSNQGVVAQSSSPPTARPSCTRNGVFSCRPIIVTCDYYTCIFYPQLNRWILSQYNCAAGSTWNGTRCVEAATTSPASSPVDPSASTSPGDPSPATSPVDSTPPPETTGTGSKRSSG